MNDNDPETVNERMGREVIGEQATDDQVQNAADMVDGVDDGLEHLPSTDIGNALAALKEGRADKLDLFYIVARDMVVRGDLHGTAAEDIEAAGILGAELVSLAIKLAAVVAK